GLEPRRVTVEIDVRAGLPNFTIVGLGDRSVRESSERVRAAILNSGFEFPLKRVTVNLAPASMRKAGPGFDLAIACAILAVGGHIPADALERYAVFGELGLGGEIRPCRGALAVAEGTAEAGLAGLGGPRQRVPGARVAAARAGGGGGLPARRLPSTMPPLTRAEAVEVTRIHSIAGQHRRRGLVGERPFRAPHHMISASGLVGGGAGPLPGEGGLA